MSIKRIISLVLSVIMLVSCVLSIVSCSEPDDQGGGGNNETINPAKTQLYVHNYNGGFGSDWLFAAKERFEEFYKNTSFEEGKMGVQVMVTPQKTQMPALSSQVLGGGQDIYINEYCYYYELKAQGLLADITDAVTGTLSEYGEDSSIFDKLTDEQKAYYGVQESDGKTHYYGVPHYEAFTGIMYNVDLFEDNGYYFAATPTGTQLYDYFISATNTKKANGPDGKEGTPDDGLPATYEQFFMLCDYIASDDNIPCIWTGANYQDYLNNLIQALSADYSGLEQTMLNYTLNGSATSLATVDGNGIKLDEASTVITEENAYELARQAGKYYALSFVERLIDNKKYYGGEDTNVFDTVYMMTDAQNDFLFAGHDGVTKNTAMLIEGDWWEMEASNTFQQMVDRMGENYSKDNRKFALMSFPKATEAQVGKGSTLFDTMYSMMFVSADIADWKIPLAVKFIQFCNTNESLVEYTQITNTTKALKYTMTDEEKAELSHFGKSVMNLKENSDIVYPYSTTPTYVNNQTFFSTHQHFNTSIDGLGNRSWPASTFKDENVSALDYFAGMAPYYKKQWDSLN